MVQYTENVPEGWSIKQIKDIAPLQRGFDLPSKELVDGEYPVCYSNGVGNYHNEYKIKGPGVFTGRSGTIGNVFFIEEDFWPHNTSLWVTDFKGNDEKYVYYLYQSIKLNRFNAGTGVPTLNRNDVHSHKVLIPNKAVEQKRIADIIGIWDKAIELKEKLIAQKKDQKKGIMQRFLTDKKNEAYKIYKLSEILKIKHGKDQKKVQKEDGKYPILGTGGVIGRTDDYLYDKESVLIGRKGTIDRPFYMNTPFWTVDTLFYSEIKEGFLPKYIYYLFNTIPWKNYNEATGVPSLSASTIGSIKVFLPTLEMQEKVAKVLTKADEEIVLLKEEVQQLKLQKKALMQQLLTGKIRVKV